MQLPERLELKGRDVYGVHNPGYELTPSQLSNICQIGNVSFGRDAAEMLALEAIALTPSLTLSP